MKTEVIPAILTKKKSEFLSRIKIASKLSKTVQIDIMDGLFVDNETPTKLNDGSWYREYLTNNGKHFPNIELHLMVINPWEIIEHWKELTGVSRIIWHEELPLNHEEIIRAVHEIELEACLAINPDTDIKRLYPYIEKEPKKKGAQKYFVDSILVMGVVPGFSGQKFLSEALKTISTLHKKYPHLPISVDGGVNQETSKAIKNAGATRLCSAGAIFLADDPKSAYNNLSK
jgi:ribulose-phosphate 3-epimerase